MASSSRSTQSTYNAVAATRSNSNSCTTIQLRNNKQLPLPPWMKFHHLPEYGIVSSSSSLSQSASGASRPSSSSSSLLPITDGATTQGTVGARRSKRTEDMPHATTNSSNLTSNTNRNNSYTTPQVSASNYKTKKETAMDSIYPPTMQEIYGHIRYLSEEGMKLVMKEVDDCVGYSLRYSATRRSGTKKGGKKLVAGDDDDDGVLERKGLTPDLMTLAAEIHNYFDKFQPDNDDDDKEDENDTTKSLKADDASMKSTGTESRAIQRDDILRDMVPKKYEPTLLPIISIKCYPNILDRVEMTNGLLLDLSNTNINHNQGSNNPKSQKTTAQKEKKSRRPCICIVRSTSDLVQQGHVMTEVLSQCISNDPNGEAFAMELQRQRKRQKSHHHGGVNRGVLVRSIWSWTTSLVDWAAFTEAFDSIVVILEDPEGISSPTLDSFFTTLASLRSSYGVPISAIVIDATPGGLGDRLSKLRDPSLRGTMGVMAHQLFVPLPQNQLEIFVNKLFSGKCIPTSLWTNDRLLKHLQELFKECDNSILSAAKQLKSELRRYFSIPGAFISLLNCEKFIVRNDSRIKWLFGDEYCRKIILSHSASGTPSSKEDEKDGHIIDLFWKMQTSYLCHQICQRINAIFNKSPLRMIGQMANSEFHLNSRMQELLLLLSNVRNLVTSWKDSSAASLDESVSLRKKLNEYIILVGTLAEDKEANTSDGMARTLVQNIIAWATEQFSMQMILEDAPSVQPRRELAKAIMSLPPPNALTHSSLVHARRIAFQVFQSRVMSLADWHEKYFDIVSDQDGENNVKGVSSNEAAFFFAVYELVHCGFVRKLITGRRKEVAYEKVAMIWGSG